jgi:hypothetical protein
MNYEADDLLDMVDEWRFKLYDKLKAMTPEEQAAFWKQSLERAREMGLPIVGEDPPAKRATKKPSGTR